MRILSHISRNDRAMLAAATLGDSEIVQQLLTYGISPEVEDEMWMRPLHRAARHGRIEVTKVLVASGAKISVKDKFFRSPLQLACAIGNYEIVKLLLDNGADFESGDDVEINPLLQASAGTKDGGESLDIVSRLLDQGANIHARDSVGMTALGQAIMKGKSKTFHLLVQSGADIHHYDKNGWSLLHHSAYYGRADILVFLLDKGLDVNELTWGAVEPEAPLSLAKKAGHTLIQTILLSKGAKMGEPPTLDYWIHEKHARISTAECRSNYLKGADRNYKRSQRDIEDDEEIISGWNGYPLILLDRSFWICKEVTRTRSLSTIHPSIINLPSDRRFARKKPKFLISEKDHQELLNAVVEGDTIRVLTQLDKGVSPGVRDEAGVTALHFAAARGFVSITHVLLERSGKSAVELIETRDYRREMTPLH